MSRDISYLLRQWPFDAEKFQVRTIMGDSGRELIQVRLDLGMIQMELEGRPDGTSPEGFESHLDRYAHLAGEAGGAGRTFALDQEDCELLMREGVQYYYRYYAAFHLNRYEVVVRDTDRNLRLFDFVVEHATRNRDKLRFDQFRPYVIMMRSRAKASISLDTSDYPAAIESVDEGIGAIREFLRKYGHEEDEAQCSELGFLLRWRADLEREKPKGPVDELRQQLDLAVAIEDYEEAAKIRDQIQRLQDGGPSAGHP